VTPTAEILLVLTVIAFVKPVQGAYRSLKVWSKTRIDLGTQFMEKRDELNAKNAEKERLKKEREAKKAAQP
jgi:Tfp pilus assembly protein PilF